MDIVEDFLELFVTLRKVMTAKDATIHLVSIVGMMGEEKGESTGLLIDLCTQNDDICDELIEIVNESIVGHATICGNAYCGVRKELLEIEDRLIILRQQCRQEFNGSRCDLRNGHIGHHLTTVRDVRAWK